MVWVCFIFLKGWKFYKKRFLETWRLLSALIHKKTEDWWRGVRLTGWLRTEQEGGFWKRIPSNSLKGIEFVEEKVAHNEIISCANNFYEKTFWMKIRTPIDFEMMTTLAGKQTPNFFLLTLASHKCSTFFSTSHLTLLVLFRIRNKAINVFDSIGLPLGGSEWKQVTRLLLLSVQIKSASISWLLIPVFLSSLVYYLAPLVRRVN